jgi:small subunit ribosomal protein S9
MASKKKKSMIVKAKRKQAIAIASFKKGTGQIRVNKMLLRSDIPNHLNEFVAEPLMIAGESAKGYDIDINVNGGGFMGQATAVRGAIAKALVSATKDDKLKRTFLNYDRLLLVDDVRQVEPKKPLGGKARKKKQKSKR